MANLKQLIALILGLPVIGYTLAVTSPNSHEGMNEPKISAELLHHDVIVLIAVKSAQVSAWIPDPSNPLNRQRRAEVVVRLLETFKGESHDELGQSLEFSVIQVGPAKGRIADDYGPWSKCDLESSPQLLLFCQLTEPAASLALTMSKGCRVLVTLLDPSYPFALDDVRLGLSLQKSPNFPESVGTRTWEDGVFQNRQRLGPLMARFLIEATGLVNGDGVGGFLHRLLDARDTAPLCRLILIDHLTQELALQTTPARDKRIQLTRTLFQILKEPAASARIIHEDLYQNRLRNVVFNAANAPYFPASEAFADPAEREAALEQIIRHSFSPELRKLFTAWLSGE